MGSLIVGGQTVTPTFWSNNYIGFTWFTGSTPGSVSVAVIHKKGAIGNRLPITISN